jgi:hypothetical protein
LGRITRALFALPHALDRPHGSSPRTSQSHVQADAELVVGDLASTCAGIVGRIAPMRANESRTGAG